MAVLFSFGGELAISTDFRGLRPASNDPMTQIIVELQKKLAKFLTTQQVELIDSENEDIYSNGQDMDTVIKYHTFQSETHFLFTTDYYPPFEPDGQILTLYLTGKSLGNTVPDKSSFDNNASLYGDPLLIDGTPFDPGIHTQGTKSLAIRLNRPTSADENQEYLQVPDNTTLQITGVTPGCSIFVRFRMKVIDSQGGLSQTLFHKIDDNTPSNGMMLQVTDTGKLLMIVAKAGTITKKETAASTVVIDTVYDVFATFTTTGNVIHIYLNGVDQTLTTSVAAAAWQGTLTNHDLSIFRRGVGSGGGYIYGDFYDLKYYKNKVVSQTEVTNHWTNKWSISNIPFGQVGITNYSATFTAPAIHSFTSTSFTTTSFAV